MIKNTADGINEFCKRDVFGTRIKAYLNVYGNNMTTALFYVQTVDGAVTAVISKVFEDATLCCRDNADFEELSEFLRFTGYKSLLCEKSIREKLSLPVNSFGSVMRFLKPSREIRRKDGFLRSGDADFEFKKIYSLLKKCEFELGDYGEWLSDIALRDKKGVSKTLCVEDGGRVVSTASALFITEDAVYLGAVATSPEYRGKGSAGDLVLSLCDAEKRVNILCKEHRVGFYESLGFKRDGEWSL